MEKLGVKRAVTLFCLLIFASLFVPSVPAQTCGGTGTLKRQLQIRRDRHWMYYKCSAAAPVSGLSARFIRGRCI